jgi:DNA-binding NarL/FixJ family response regulator
MAMLTVFVVDDHEVVRRGVTDLLNEADDLTVIGAAATAAQAMARVPALDPDVAVVDVCLPDGDGVEVCRELRSLLPGLQCLMLTSYTHEQAMMNAFLAGAAGFVIKDITGVDLVAAVRTVGSGRSLLDQRAAAALIARLRTGTARPGPLADLTEQERAALELIGQGLTNRQIAERMFVAEKTVKNYVSRVLAKLGMTSRTQAAVLATQIRDHRVQA